MRALALVVVLLCGSGCEPPKCSPSNCDGCCDANNRCQLGTTTAACGASGNVCAVCSPLQQCQVGVCGGSSSGGGSGGGGGGGGGTTGGGTGGGVVPMEPKLKLDRSSLGFGTEFGIGTWVGTSPQRSLLVRNGGQQNLIISSATLSGAGSSAFSVLGPDAGTTLATGEQSFVRVLFTPTTVAPFQTAVLTIGTNDPAAPTAAVQLSGTGVASTGGVGSNPECRASDCLTPPRSGGSLSYGWLEYTEDGQTLSYTEDADGDGREDALDNCRFAANRDQLDGDGDGVGDVCDNCAGASNFAQADTDGDGQGDACDADLDGDTVANAADNCASIPNRDQLDTNANSMGNVCDNDDDGDGILDTLDVCPLLPNPGNVPLNDPRCNADADGDNISDSFDNCPGTVNATQLDTDLDGLGDVCDLDMDNDGLLNQVDDCGLVANRDQRDEDGDGLGDLCDPRYCVVVDLSNREDCLDPQGPFRVHAGGTITLRVNELLRLPLFANRNGAAIRYAWTVAARPAGSTASISNASGLAGLSRDWQYAYVDGLVPRFRPDRAGDYTLQLQATLGMADRAYPANQASTAQLRLTVSP